MKNEDIVELARTLHLEFSGCCTKYVVREDMTEEEKFSLFMEAVTKLITQIIVSHGLEDGIEDLVSRINKRLLKNVPEVIEMYNEAKLKKESSNTET